MCCAKYVALNRAAWMHWYMHSWRTLCCCTLTLSSEHCAMCNVAHCTVNWEVSKVSTVQSCTLHSQLRSEHNEHCAQCTVNRAASNADALKCWRTSTKVFTVTFLLLVDHSSFLLLIVIILNTRQSCQLLTTNYVYTFFTGFGVGVGEII